VSPRARAGALALWLALVTTGACTSPEATRRREGGAGADPGNRGDVVRLHEGADPYWRTPRRLAERLRAPSDEARQADRQSRGKPDPSALPGTKTR
jgi:hypothetical protein